jgi:hypothetical protein
MRFFHAKARGAVSDEQSNLNKGPWIEQQVQPLSGGQFVFAVLGGDPFFPAAQVGLVANFFQLIFDGVHMLILGGLECETLTKNNPGLHWKLRF